MKPLETLYDATHGKSLPLPPRLARLYGRLRMPLVNWNKFSPESETNDGDV